MGYAVGNSNLFGYVIGNPLSYVDPDGRVAFLGGCAIGATVSSGVAFLISWWTGDDPGTCACKSVCAAAGGCVQGAAIATFPGVVGGCIGGFAGEIVKMACEAGCGIRPPLNRCTVGRMAISTFLGCMGGGAADAENANVNLILTLVGVDAELWRSICGVLDGGGNDEDPPVIVVGPLPDTPIATTAGDVFAPE